MTASPTLRMKVAIGENHADLALTLSMLLDLQPDMRSVGHAPTCAGVLALGDRERPDAYVLDLTLDDGSSIPVIHALRKREPGCVIIAFTGLSDPLLAAQCQRAGCDATLVKDGRVEELLKTLRTLRAAQDET
jgi:two-component system response regulator DesR